MRVRVEHPTDRPNYCEVTIGELTIWFSYKTPIAFHTPETGKVRRVNDWGPTTGRHFSQVGPCRKTLTGVEFEEHLSEIERGFVNA